MSALEAPAVYIFVCNVVGAYLDGENFAAAKRVLKEHMLWDLAGSSPSATEGSYDLKDLRIASGLNFLGLANWSDHSACGGHGHGHEGHSHAHTHSHDHSIAEKSWKEGLEYTRPFLSLIQAHRPIGALDDTDALMLQAATSLLDNLSQLRMSEGDIEGCVAASTEVVHNLAAAFAPMHHDLVSAQSQLLKTLLEAQKMDEAELLCEEMLKGFPHPSRTPALTPSMDMVAAIPPIVKLDTARVLDELSNVMFQFGNLDYAEKFLQLSLMVLQARLGGEPGQTSSGPSSGPADLPPVVTQHPALARAYNGLGLLQIQMKDFASAETNLQVGLDMKLALASLPPDVPFSPPAGLRDDDADVGAGGSRVPPSDDGTAEFFHNLGLAQMGLAKLQEAETNLLQAQTQYLARFTDKDTGKVDKVQANYGQSSQQQQQQLQQQQRAQPACLFLTPHARLRFRWNSKSNTHAMALTLRLRFSPSAVAFLSLSFSHCSRSDDSTRSAVQVSR